MRRLFASRISVGAAAGIVVLLLASGGYAIAAGGGTIHACAQRHGGHLLYTGKCRKGDQGLSWNIQGPQGRSATSYFAWVAENGTLEHGSPDAVAAKSLEYTGVYTVTFPGKNLNACVPVASPGQTSNNGYVPEIQVNAVVDSWPGQGGNHSVIDVLTTSSSSGASENAAFQMAVFC